MASSNDLVAIRSKLDPGLSDEDLRYLLGRMDRVEGASGVDLIERGKVSDALYLLVEGTMVAHVDADGRKLKLGQVDPGHWLGELHYIDPGPSSATVTSETPFVVLRLRGAHLEDLIDHNPHAASSLLRSLSREIAERLVHTSGGVLERISDDTYRVSDSGQRRDWFAELLGRVFGRRKGTS